MNKIYSIVFNHGQEEFIENNISNGCLPYSDRNIQKIIVADDSGRSNTTLKQTFRDRNDFSFIDKDQEILLPVYMQQIYSLYECLRKIDLDDSDLIHLLDGDDFMISHSPLKFDDTNHNYFIAELTEVREKNIEHPSKLLRKSSHKMWTKVVPTSGIIVNAGFLKKYEELIKLDLFGDVWLDTRINFLIFYLNFANPNNIQKKFQIGKFYRGIHDSNHSHVSLKKKISQLIASRKLWLSLPSLVKEK